MAKPQRKPDPLVIESRAEADSLLAEIGRLEASIQDAEIDATLKAQLIRDEMEAATEPIRLALAARVKALHAWAKKDEKNWPGRTCELTNGKVYFRTPPAAIKEELETETIVQRLRARKMTSCIRTKEEVDKEALAAYPDSVIEAVGCRRTKPKDKFYYEVKKEEVKA